MSTKQRTLITAPARILFLPIFHCVYTYIQAEAKAGNGTEAWTGGIQTQKPIKDLSPNRPAFRHLEIHTFSVESNDGILCVSRCQYVSLSLTNTTILSCFLFMPHWLINHSWEQSGASIDNTDAP